MAQLGDVALIMTGVTLRARPDPEESASVRLLQLGDIDLAGSINLNNIGTAGADGLPDRFRAREGDLIFRPRGAGMAVALMPPHEGVVVVAAPLILIRPDPGLVDPGYLVWALRTSRAQQHFALHARGTSVIGVGKRDLETLQIPLPDLPTQHRIAAVVALQQREADLLRRLQATRQQLIDSLLASKVDNS